MAAQSSQPKSTSRWGSLLQQAVAGVESRLDNILADDDSSTTVTVRKDAVNHPGQRAAMTMTIPITASPSINVSREASMTRKNGRLQERLSKAVITRNNPKSGASSGLLSRSASPNKAVDSSRGSMDSKSDGTISVINGMFPETEKLHGCYSPSDQLPRDSDAMVDTSTSRELDVQRTLPFEAVDSTTRTSSESHDLVPNHLCTRSFPPESSSLNRFGSTLNTAVKIQPTIQSEMVIDQMRAKYETAELGRQNETHRYFEHIDALQAKLQYLTREATDFAKKTKSEAEAGSVEQMLAIKDEKIALLMGEGQELAQNELKYMNTIKKLRTRVMEDAKSLKETQRINAELEKAKTSMEERAKEAEDSRRENFRQQKTLQEQEIQLEEAKLDNSRRAIEHAELQQQLSNSQSVRGVNEVTELGKLVEAQKKTMSEMRDDLSNVKLERELTDERHQGHVRELQEKFNRGNEKAKVTEVELRGELSVLESRLESLRARAEDISSGNSGDTQAKLLRQIETLQTQYAVANENWRGIEGSLLARISRLESERDDLAKREGDIRRKARTMVNQCRQLENQKEESSSQIQVLEQQFKEQKAQLSKVHQVLASTEAEVVKLQKDVMSERKNWQARLEENLETQKRESQSQNFNTSSPQIRTELPVVQNRQKWKAEKASPHGRRHQAGSGSGLVNATIPSTDRSMARRHSGQPPHFSESGMPHRLGSLASTSQPSLHNGIPETPSSETYHQEDFFDGIISATTPERSIDDIFSASTAAAGPSVQLVERMSAAVRRLESEKAATRDDLDRLLAQRDEAREQVVTLMREVEGKRVADAKILKLEMEVEEINQRYQTTLEMLGEKSEMVDELQADIGDVKQMYRDLVNSTMR
ncbi:hypothetical protein MMC17_003606 [Xylographa soralifera]|nr:hypothetical protein [Xylographa soralifera]